MKYLLYFCILLFGLWVDPILLLITFLCYKGIKTYKRFWLSFGIYWLLNILTGILNLHDITLEGVVIQMIITFVFLIFVEFALSLMEPKGEDKNHESVFKRIMWELLAIFTILWQIANIILGILIPIVVIYFVYKVFLAE